MTIKQLHIHLTNITLYFLDHGLYDSVKSSLHKCIQHYEILKHWIVLLWKTQPEILIYCTYGFTEEVTVTCWTQVTEETPHVRSLREAYAWV